MTTTPVPEGHFRCEVCGEVYPLGDPEVVAAEHLANFGYPQEPDAANLCDRCYDEFKAWATKQGGILVNPENGPT